MSDDDLPRITVHPAYQFGRPCLEGTRIPADILAEFVLAGDSVDSTADAYDVSRAAVLAACWHEATYGEKRVQQHWREWLEAWFRSLAGYDHAPPLSEVPDPPEMPKKPRRPRPVKAFAARGLSREAQNR
jgi:uncharacterized protein (DUF433 family)